METQEKELKALSEKVFALANELSIAGYGNAAVAMHLIHNNLSQGQDIGYRWPGFPI